MPKKLTTEDFIQKARSIHGDKYDYSLVEYVKSHEKVKIICKDHGEFEQTPNKHLTGMGCSKCSKKYKPSTNEFIQRAKEIHGNRYDYSLVEYIKAHIKVKIICPEHGTFSQTPDRHINGKNGCSLCGIRIMRKKQSNIVDEFIQKAKITHGEKYDYSLVDYKNTHTKVKIICPSHNTFIQKPSKHLSGSGCPKCTYHISKPEIELQEYIKSIYSNQIITNSRTIIYPYELDIYLPDINLAIEFNGDYWHSSEDAKRRDRETKRLCKEGGIRLMIVWERHWVSNRDRIKKSIQNSINKRSKQIY